MPNNFTVINDPVVYTPGGRELRCSEVIAMRGGWENLSAEEATDLSSLGCFPGFISYDSPAPVDVGDVFFRGDTSTGGAVSSEPISQPDAKISEELPLWTSSVPMTTTQEPIMPGVNFGAIDNDPFISTVPMQTSGGNWAGWLQGALEGLAGTMPEFFQKDQIEAGITAIGNGMSCWTPTKSGRLSRRAKVKIVRDASGVHLVKYCSPRRMNPCNPRALGRSVRRLAMFQKLASRVNKVITRQLRSAGARPRASFGRPCGPKKCR